MDEPETTTPLWVWEELPTMEGKYTIGTYIN